jgi:Xaa-Pro aminopeptidase
MIVQPNEVEKWPVIQTYKKWLETGKANPYPLQLEHSFYYLVRYYRFKDIKGYLMLNEGGSPLPPDLARTVFYYMNGYNSILYTALHDIRKNMSVPLSPFEEILQTMKEVETKRVNEVQAVSGQWSRVTGMLEKQIDGRRKLVDIYDEIARIGEEQKRRGYLTVEDFQAAAKQLESYNDVLYEEGSIQYDTLEDTAAVIDALQSLKSDQEMGEKSGKAAYLLKEKTAASALANLDRSMQTFERDESGRLVTKMRGELPLEEVRRMMEKKTEANFRKNLYPLVRN